MCDIVEARKVIIFSLQIRFDIWSENQIADDLYIIFMFVNLINKFQDIELF